MKLKYTLFPTLLLITACICLPGCRKSNPILESTITGRLVNDFTGEPIAHIKIQLKQCNQKNNSECQVRGETISGPDGRFSITYKGRKRMDYFLIPEENDTLRMRGIIGVHPTWEPFEAIIKMHVRYKTRLHLIVRKNNAKELNVNGYIMRGGPVDTVFTYHGSPAWPWNAAVSVMDDAAGYRRGRRFELPVKTDHSSILTVDIPDMMQEPQI